MPKRSNLEQYPCSAGLNVNSECGMFGGMTGGSLILWLFVPVQFVLASSVSQTLFCARARLLILHNRTILCHFLQYGNVGLVTPALSAIPSEMCTHFLAEKKVETGFLPDPSSGYVVHKILGIRFLTYCLPEQLNIFIGNSHFSMWIPIC